MLLCTSKNKLIKSQKNLFSLRINKFETKPKLFSYSVFPNKRCRSLNGTRVKDMISIASLLKKFNLLSVNQLNANIKLVEIWKALNVDDYPLKIEQQSTNNHRVSTRADTKEKPIEIGKTVLTQKSCVSDAIRLWNSAPASISNCVTLSLAKLEIKKFVRQLPI